MIVLSAENQLSDFGAICVVSLFEELCWPNSVLIDCANRLENMELFFRPFGKKKCVVHILVLGIPQRPIKETFGKFALSVIGPKCHKTFDIKK